MDDIKIRAIFDDLKDKSEDKRLHEEAIVDFARPDESPLHDEFEWDDTIAGAKFRLVQAGCLIRRVHVTIQKPTGGEAVSVRAYVSLASDRIEGGGYRPILEVMTDEQRYQEMLATALAELENFQRRFRELKELSPILQTIDKATKRIRRKIEREQPRL